MEGVSTDPHLINAELGRATRHRFVGLVVLRAGTKVVGYAPVFRCTEIGTVRRWGLLEAGPHDFFQWFGDVRFLADAELRLAA